MIIKQNQFKKLGTIFIYLENIKNFDRHRLLCNAEDKIRLKESDKYVTLSNLNICYT